MPYIQVKDFQRGLDARKFMLTEPAGTLLIGNNGHITPGGEFEKRKAFVPIFATGQTVSLPGGATPQTFGLQEAGNGIYVFGSIAAAALAFTPPAPFIYQRLQHPAVIDGFVADGSGYAMTAVIHSTVFGGFPFVVASFADGNVFAYYNGVLVRDFEAGQVWPWMVGASLIGASTVENLAIDLKNAAQTEPTGQTNGYTGQHTAGTGRSDLISAVGEDYTGAATVDSTSGTLSVIAVSSSTPANVAYAASGSFNITACNLGSGTIPGSITSVKVNGGANLLNGGTAVAAQSSATLTAAAVVNAINANSSSAFVASANGSQVILTAKATGTAANGYNITVVTSGNMAIGNGSIQLAFNTGVTSVNIPTNSFLTVPSGATTVNLLPSTWPTSSNPSSYPTYGGVTLAAAYTDLTQLAQIMANAITSNVSANGGYVAAAYGYVVVISKQTTTSADAAITITISGVPTGLTVQGTAGGSFDSPNIAMGTNYVYSSKISYVVPNGENDGDTITLGGYNCIITSQDITYARFTPVVTGGVSPYTYAWKVTSQSSLVSASNGDGATASTCTLVVAHDKLAVQVGNPSNIVGISKIVMQLTVTDSGGQTATASATFQ